MYIKYISNALINDLKKALYHFILLQLSKYNLGYIK
jgi:hypothetical protein